MSLNPVTLTAQQWEDFLASLYERDQCLDCREDGARYYPDENVDPYVLSAHAEALRSAEVEGDLWETLADLDETAQDEAEAWQKITAFYLDRGAVLIKVTGLDDTEEWIFSEPLAARLGLLDA